MMDPASRFLDTEDAGGQTKSMADMLQEHKGPIYTCELDDRCPGLVEYPLEEVVQYSNCHYLNNTVAYAVAFAYWNEVANLKMFGVDFSYKGNLHFAEAGRGCVEFWIANCINRGIKVAVAPRSSLLDTDVEITQKLYGYHRLDDPTVTYQDESGIKACKWSQVEKEEKKPVGMIGREDIDLEPVEPEKY